MDPFATLGIERRFDLDLRSIEKTHRDLSRVMHPDRHADGSASTRAEALGRSVQINEAFRIVRDPIRRAESLFALAGIPVGEINEPKPTQEFLAEMLEQRELLEAAKEARDLGRVHSLAEAMQGHQRTTEAALGSAFSAAGGDRVALAQALHLLGELRFYHRFLEEVSAIEDALTGLS